MTKILFLLLIFHVHNVYSTCRTNMNYRILQAGNAFYWDQEPGSHTLFCPVCADREFFANPQFYQNQLVTMIPQRGDASDYPPCVPGSVTRVVCPNACLNVTINYTVHGKPSEIHMFDCGRLTVRMLYGKDDYRKINGYFKQNVDFFDRNSNKVNMELHFFRGTYTKKGMGLFTSYWDHKKWKEETARKLKEDQAAGKVEFAIHVVVFLIVIAAICIAINIPVESFPMRDSDIKLARRMNALKKRLDRGLAKSHP